MIKLHAATASLSALLIGMLVSTGAAAQATWNLPTTASGGNCSAPSSGTYGNTTTCAATTGAGSMTLSAWSMDRGSGATLLAGSGYANAFLSDQGGLGWGDKNRTEGLTATSPDHSVDNITPGLADLLLLNFTSGPTALSGFRFGWSAGDSDAVVMRWAGAGSPIKADGVNLDSTIGNTGWVLVGAYADVGTGNLRSTGTTAGSSWWLISAFNTTMTGGSTACTSAAGAATTCADGNDGFKLQYVTTAAPSRITTGVPEPTSVALAGLALFGIFAARRRNA